MRSRLVSAIVGVATTLGIVALARRALAAPETTAGNGDVDDLARVLVVELGGAGTESEQAGICHTALNRSLVYNAPIARVVRSQVRGRSEWGSGCGRNTACAYNGDLDAADTHPRFAAMRTAAERVVAGAVPNPIGPRINFCHPAHSTFARSRAEGSAEERAAAFALRQEAAVSPPGEARSLYERANIVERVDAAYAAQNGRVRYAWDPPTGRYLPVWAVHRNHGGKAVTTPITIGSTRFA